MRNVIANIALSLDGRVAGPGGEYDMSWIVPHAISEGARSHMVRVTGGATTALLGRKNYQGFGGFWPSVAEDENADPKDRTFARWLDTVEKVVFSTTLDQVEWDNARLATAGPAATVKELRRQEGGDIIVLASVSVIQQLLDAGEVDRLSVTQCPEIVGGGARPLFTDEIARSSWTLTDTTRTDSGALCLLYDRNEG
ncbi:dihydrofolate reductase family protein [Actinomadura graeca]|uniref:Dihydrofolate reductase family protein n=1 Tax=Actinomadura graeca TaxID=2750812 RepID=A0ABX8QZ66_9ACTN|nr:dihydrofolate reductase family protein [Actinomadura graeca]QXJ23289.1 dihydrofolate reductase family protein [Actinomadura graeca]